jgi:hypothetical protein
VAGTVLKSVGALEKERVVPSHSRWPNLVHRPPALKCEQLQCGTQQRGEES